MKSSLLRRIRATIEIPERFLFYGILLRNFVLRNRYLSGESRMRFFFC